MRERERERERERLEWPSSMIFEKLNLTLLDI